MSGASITDHVIDYALGVDLSVVPPAVLETAKLSIADCLAVTVAGSQTAVGRAISAHVNREGGAPRARLIGQERLVSQGQAALANGTMAHALDFDDDEPILLIGHPTAPVLCALMAFAHEERYSGADLLTALIVGIEVELAVGDVVNPFHYDSGWHTTSSIGTLGAAVACARLLGLDGTQARAALGIAASASAGLKRNFGTMTKPLHVGRASEAGVLAASLAREGFTADQAVLDGPFSLSEMFGATDRPSALAKISRLGQEHGMLTPGVAIKRYPSCSNTHPALDAVAELFEAGAFTEPPQEIECRVAPGTERMLQFTIPSSGLEGKFSMHYCLAVAIVHGPPQIKHFTDEAIGDPLVHAVMSRIQLVSDPALQIDGEGVSTAASVTVTGPDGRAISRTVRSPVGSGQRPLHADQLREKFLACCLGVLGDGSSSIFDRLMSIETEPAFHGLLDEVAKAT